MSNNLNNRRPQQESPIETEMSQTAPAKKIRPLLKVGITQGDTNGVGYELIFKTFAENTMFEICTPVVYGSTKIAQTHRKALNLNVPFKTIGQAEQAEEGTLSLINCLDDAKVNFGQIEKEAGHAAFIALERATADLRAGRIDVLVTAPICKSAIQSEAFPFSGHTEYLADRLKKEEGEQPLMILTNEMMRIALVTTHLPLSDVSKVINKEIIVDKIKSFYKTLRRDFLLSNPRIAVLGLNPHNGDEGVMGEEESTHIIPAIQEMAEAGIPCYGPYAADGFFGSAAYHHFDGVLAMYHDQGLAPFKALSMDDGVNFTAGLSYVRTSPDHGTAFDIAGKGEASENSIRQAIYLAIDIYLHRAADDLAHENPLPKLYHEKREDSERQRHTLPEKSSEANTGKHAPKENPAPSQPSAEETNQK